MVILFTSPLGNDSGGWEKGLVFIEWVMLSTSLFKSSYAWGYPLISTGYDYLHAFYLLVSPFREVFTHSSSQNFLVNNFPNSRFLTIQPNHCLGLVNWHIIPCLGVFPSKLREQPGGTAPSSSLLLQGCRRNRLQVYGCPLLGVVCILWRIIWTRPRLSLPLLANCREL